MDIRVRIPHRLLVLTAAVLAGGTFGWGVARAAIPDPSTSLVYSGVLEDDGALVDGPRTIAVELHRSAAATDTGDLLCRVAPGAVPVNLGRFHVALDGFCADAVRANPDVFVEVQVDGAAVGARTKLGAVPFAVEADHATTSDQATSADAVSCTGCIDETRLPARALAPDRMRGGVLFGLRTARSRLARGHGLCVRDG